MAILNYSERQNKYDVRYNYDNYSERQNKFDFHYNYFIYIALHIRWLRHLRADRLIVNAIYLLRLL